MMNKRHNKKLNTTLGELAAAFYEAALSELHDEAAAAKVAEAMLASVRLRRA
jgi:hypothetical protein